MSAARKEAHQGQKGAAKPMAKAAKVIASGDDLDGNFAPASLKGVVRGAMDDSDDEGRKGAASASAAKSAALPGKSGLQGGAGVGKKRSRAEMEAADSKGKARGDDEEEGAGGAGAAGKTTTYQRVAKDLLSKEPSAETQVAKFWSLFTATKVGARLTDEEVLRPLTASMLSTTGASAITGSTEDLSDLPAVIKAALPGWKTAMGLKWEGKGPRPKRPAGMPSVVIVTYSAQRAAAMLKPLASFGVRIAKLFAKHLSVEEQIEILRGPPIVMAVGTPNRISKLLSLSASSSSSAAGSASSASAAAAAAAPPLSLAQCSLIIFDVHPDSKNFNLLNHPNLREDAFTFYREHCHPALTRGGAGSGSSAPGPITKMAFY